MIRRVLLSALLFVSTFASAQFTGSKLTPTTKFQQVNKSVVVYGQLPSEAKFMYMDNTHYVARPFTSTTEANAYLTIGQRHLGLTVYINTGGTINTGAAVVVNGVTILTGQIMNGTNAEYHYKDGISDADLVLKAPGGGGGGPTYSVAQNSGIVLSGTTFKLDTVPGSIGSVSTLKALKDSLENARAQWTALTPKAGLGIIKTLDTIKTNFPYVSSRTLLRAAPLPVVTNAYTVNVAGQLRNYLYDPFDNTTVDDSVMTIRAAGGGTYKMLYDYGVDPVWFGAIPNDGLDDTPAFQKAVNFAGASTKIKKVWIGTIGQYNITNLVLAKFVEGQAQQFSVTLEGAMNSTSQGVSFKNNNPNSATIHIVQAQGIDIIHIGFEGIGPDLTDYVNNDDAQWAVGVGSVAIRNNKKTPYCAINIDGFFTGAGSTVTASGDQYPGMSAWYSNTSYAGSTNVNINNCYFSRMYVGVAEGLSGAPNGEGIHIEGGFGIYTAYIWAAGQLQSRENTIRHFYFIFGHTFVSNIEWGTGIGDVPAVNNSNINYLKYIARVGGNFTIPRFNDGYSEGIWSIGISTSQVPFIFNNWNLTLVPNAGIIPGQAVGMAPVLFQSNGSFIYNGGNIQSGNYFSGFPFNCQDVTFNGTRIEGGYAFNTNLTTYTDNIHYRSVNFFGAGANIRLDEGRSETLIDAQLYTQRNLTYFLPGGKLKGLDNRVHENVGPLYEKIDVGPTPTTGYTVTVTAANGKLSFTSSNPGQFSGGDLIYTTTPVNFGADSYASSGASLGFVDSILGSKIVLSNVPAGVVSGQQYKMYILRVPRFVGHTLGTLTAGSPTITNVISDNGPFVAGDRINGEGILPGTRVNSVSGNTITMSTNATATSDLVELQDAKIRTTAEEKPFVFYGANYTYDNLPVIWFNGDEIMQTQKGATYRSRYVIKPGLVASANPPTFYVGVSSAMDFTDFGIGGGYDALLSNAYYDNSITGWRRKKAGAGSIMYFDQGTLHWQAFTNGGAGTVADVAERLTISPSGKLTVSSTTDVYSIQANGGDYSYIRVNSSTGSSNGGFAIAHNNADKWVMQGADARFNIYNNALSSTALSIDSSNNKVTIYGRGSYSGARSLLAFDFVYKQHLDSIFNSGSPINFADYGGGVSIFRGFNADTVKTRTFIVGLGSGLTITSVGDTAIRHSITPGFYAELAAANVFAGMNKFQSAGEGYTAQFGTAASYLQIGTAAFSVPTIYSPTRIDVAAQQIYVRGSNSVILQGTTYMDRSSSATSIATQNAGKGFGWQTSNHDGTNQYFRWVGFNPRMSTTTPGLTYIDVVFNSGAGGNPEFNTGTTYWTFDSNGNFTANNGANITIPAIGGGTSGHRVNATQSGSFFRSYDGFTMNVSSNTTVTFDDAVQAIMFKGQASAISVTLPDPTAHPFRILRFRNGTNQTATFSRAIDYGTATRTTLAANGYIEIMSDGITWNQLAYIP